ncbi:betaine-aldehyde dehydrogenase [Ferruginivarius sediminum]|uniref:Betaine-aldehyde dehydrogenase n=1 Tax=Ferruginivarius sediminum TaxID=2661937 RepID=A0A369TF60_9PROT|nr:betaine-aldehyde dehydrogenase [Ferruginivarius sediminum]RDD62757.1 betaine-aldehyde dehydrogenase [Ferruginivarius sediminum]
MPSLPEQTLYIAGKFTNAVSADRFETINPANGEVIATVQQAGAEDVERAVASAEQGFREWSAMSGTARGRVLKRAAELLRRNRDELAALETLDAGKPLSETPEADVDSGADCLEYFGGLAATLHGEYLEVDDAFVYTRREPLGVCAGIGAWNYPLQIACWKSAPALACGNAMIFKPAELTPLSALRLAEIFTEAGLPAGVFNVVHGFAETGQLLVRHPRIAKVSLTGEAGTGRTVASEATGSSLKHVTMELGGKSPLLVFDDADLDNAVSGAMLGNFYTQGEVCTNCTRVFLHERVHDAFMEKLVERTKKIRLGDPADPETQMGPLISAAHRDLVLGYIKHGRDTDKAELVAGGGIPHDPALARGYYVQPTIFDRCNDQMKIVREEIFGPVMSVLTFNDEDEAIQRANDTEYGLAGGVFTSDLDRGHRVAARLQAGVCWVNHYNVTPIEMTFGGVKRSGLGRENGRQAIEYYSQLKSVYVATGDCEAPF